MGDELTDEDIDKLNETLEVLQNDVQNIIDSILDEKYEQAIDAVQSAMKHTECSVCRDKFTIIGADIVKTKMLCKIGDNKCKPQQNESVAFAEKVKDTFLPIATEKNIVNQRSISNGDKPVYTKENKYKPNYNLDDINITPFSAPLLLLDDLMRELSK